MSDIHAECHFTVFFSDHTQIVCIDLSYTLFMYLHKTTAQNPQPLTLKQPTTFLRCFTHLSRCALFTVAFIACPPVTMLILLSVGITMRDSCSSAHHLTEGSWKPSDK